MYIAIAPYACTGKIPVHAATQYSFSAGSARVYSIRYFSGDSGGTFISGEDLSGNTFTTPANCTYLAINLFSATHTTSDYNAAIAVAQLELGNVVTQYEAYKVVPELQDENIENGKVINSASVQTALLLRGQIMLTLVLSL